MSKKILHVGCGHKRIAQTTKGFNDGSWSEIRLDIDPKVKPDIIGTMLDMSKVQTGTVQGIFSSHNIEHLYPHEVGVAFAEFIRVLSEDGFCVITCPDLRSVCQMIAEDKLLQPAYVSPMGPITPLDILYGHRDSLLQGNFYMAHRCGFTEKVLSSTLRSSGFKSIASLTRPNKFDIWAIASKSNLPETNLRTLAEMHFPL